MFSSWCSSAGVAGIASKNSWASLTDCVAVDSHAGSNDASCSELVNKSWMGGLFLHTESDGMTYQAAPYGCAADFSPDYLNITLCQTTNALDLGFGDTPSAVNTIVQASMFEVEKAGRCQAASSRELLKILSNLYVACRCRGFDCSIFGSRLSKSAY